MAVGAGRGGSCRCILGWCAGRVHAENRDMAGTAAAAGGRGGDFFARECIAADLCSVDDSGGGGYRHESEDCALGAAAGAGVGVGSGHGIFSNTSDRAGEDRRGTRHRLYCADAAGNAVVHIVQRDCGGDVDSVGPARGFNAVPLHAVAAVDEADSSRNLSLPDYGDDYGFRRGLECFGDGGVLACERPDAGDDWTGSAD